MVLAGRERERAVVVALLEAARGGAGGALVVRGIAGSGKSALLSDVAATVSPARVLRTSGVESESPLAFAALQRLLWPLRGRTATLPGPQRKALQVALGEAEGPGDRFLTFLGTLGLLADAAEQSPLLVVVDDAHWLDDASEAALLFVARRLQAERIALLFAAREGSEYRFDAEGVPSISLDDIHGEAADAILRTHGAGTVDPAVRDRLVTSTGGNPLALVELAATLTADQLAGRIPLPAELPLTGGVEVAFLNRYRRLPEPAQRFLLVAVADDTGRLPVVREAADRLGIGGAALDDVERTGLLRVEGDVLVLYHPLVRSAVYRAAISSDRRAAHRALADVLEGDPDRRAWHLAAATDRPDTAVVAALDDAAERAAGRGGHEAASEAWARAAELTDVGEERGRRLYLAASSSWVGGKPVRASALAQAAAADLAEPLLRARLLTLQGQIAWNTRSLNDGYDFVLQAAQVAATVDDALAQQLAMLAASLAAFGATSPRTLDPATLVSPPRPDAAPHVRAAAELLRGFVAVAGSDWPGAAVAFGTAFELTDADPIDDQVLQPNLGVAAMLIDDDERGLRLHEQQLTAARAAAAMNMVEHALTRGAYFQIATGAWARAAAAAAAALPLTESTGQPGLVALPTAELALLTSLRGDDQAAERHLADVEAIRRAHPIGITDLLVVDLAHWARGLLSSQPATAFHHLEQIASPVLRRMAAIDRLETAVRAGRGDLARTWLTELEAFAEGSGMPSAVAAMEHGRALLTENGDVEGHYLRALEAHARSGRLPARARTELAYGEYLRRSRRRVDAREHLRAALALFEDLGAARWAERAATELRASGETARRRDVSSINDLTAAERQVAALVRQGLSNRDVAAQLFVSPRTVDFHLRNVFSKLGVASRAELIALPLEL